MSWLGWGVRPTFTKIGCRELTHAQSRQGSSTIAESSRVSFGVAILDSDGWGVLRVFVLEFDFLRTTFGFRASSGRVRQCIKIGNRIRHCISILQCIKVGSRFQWLIFGPETFSFWHWDFFRRKVSTFSWVPFAGWINFMAWEQFRRLQILIWPNPLVVWGFV